MEISRLNFQKEIFHFLRFGPEIYEVVASVRSLTKEKCLQKTTNASNASPRCCDNNNEIFFARSSDGRQMNFLQSAPILGFVWNSDVRQKSSYSEFVARSCVQFD